MWQEVRSRLNDWCEENSFEYSETLTTGPPESRYAEAPHVCEVHIFGENKPYMKNTFFASKFHANTVELARSGVYSKVEDFLNGVHPRFPKPKE